MNVNGAAIALTGMVALGGLATTFIWKSFVKDQILYGNSHFPHGRQYSELKRVHFWKDFDAIDLFSDSEFDDESFFTQFTDRLERSFNKYDIDLMICLQKFACTTARDAAKNVAKGRGTSMEKIIDGITR